METEIWKEKSQEHFVKNCTERVSQIAAHHHLNIAAAEAMGGHL
jgi:hypothetical protein